MRVKNHFRIEGFVHASFQNIGFGQLENDLLMCNRSRGVTWKMVWSNDGLYITKQTRVFFFCCQGVHLEVDSAKSLAVSLDAANIPDEPYFNTLLRIMATRCMMQAVYFCSGMLAEEEFLHYGLATPIYTHFTSPIRRFVITYVCFQFNNFNENRYYSYTNQ